MDTSDSSDSDKDISRKLSSNNEKIKRSLQSLVEQMEVSSEELAYRSENFKNVNLLEDYPGLLECTKCGINLKVLISKGKSIDIHPLLSVLMCESCSSFYGDGNFSLDSDGDDKYCRWCGEGGTIFVCSKCICGFCDKCVKKHFGKVALKEVKEDDDWICYFCNPKPLWKLRSICSLAKESLDNLKESLNKEKGKFNFKSKNGRDGKITYKKEDKYDEDTMSDSCDDTASDIHKKGSKRKRFTKTKEKPMIGDTSSSEEEKENQFRKTYSRRTIYRQRDDKHSKEDSNESDIRIPKKRQKVSKSSSSNSDDSSQCKMQKEDNSLFEKRKSVVVEKLKGIWKLTETIADVGLNSSKKRLENLNKPTNMTLKSLEKEYQKLKWLTSVLSSSLKVVFESVASVEKDLTCDSVSNENEGNVFLLNEEIKLKSIANKLREDSDSDNVIEESQECVAEGMGQTAEDTSKKKKPNENQEKTKKTTNRKGKISNTSSDVDVTKEEDKVLQTSTKESTSGSEEVKNGKEDSKSAKEGESSREKPPVLIQKPLLKVKSFATMLADNILETKDKKDNKNDDSIVEITTENEKLTFINDNKKKVSEKDRVTVTSSDSEKTSETNGETCKISNIKENLDNIGESGNQVNAEQENNDEQPLKKKRNLETTISNLSDETEDSGKAVIKRAKKKKTVMAQSFEKFREKREKFLRSSSAKDNNKWESDKSDGEKGNEKDRNTVLKKSIRSKVLESSDSETCESNKNTNKNKVRFKKIVVGSSDEENDKMESDLKPSEEKTESQEEDTDSESGSSISETRGKQNEKNLSDSSEKSTKPILSSGDTSSDENTGTKNKRSRLLKKKGIESSSSDEDGKGKKKKGRKNINKILKKDSLHMETKEALENEEQRKKRIQEKEKLYEEIFSKEKRNESLILDFDPETKEPLVVVHKKLVKYLKPHQAMGVRFMWDNCFESVKRLEEDSGSGCILAHCMGLGKTLQVVTLVHTVMTHDLGVNCVLVVCPLSTVTNWVHEFEMWLGNIHTEPITLYDLLKYRKADERIFHLEDWHRNGGVLFISYDLFRTLTKEFKGKKTKSRKTFESTLLDPGPDLVVCDEGHLLKNQDTALSKCMNRIKTSRRIVLTGTPLQNRLMEYHCMVQFVKPNILGTKKEFSNRFINPIINGQFEDSTELDVKIMKRRAHVLHSMLDGCVQRFDYSVLTPFLPEKQEYVLSISLTETQAKVYRHFISTLSAKATGNSKATTLFNHYHSLQKIWTHPRTMLMHSERESLRELEKEDSEGSLKDFVVRSDEEEITTSGSESSNSGSTIEKAKPRRRVLRSNANDPEVRKEIEEEEKNLNKHWWDDFYKEEDFDDLQASSKLVLLFALLKHCREIKDKVLVFSQSLYSLDLIEYFLRKVDEASEDRIEDFFLFNFKDSWVLGCDYFRLDGSTSSDLRTTWCKNFNKKSNDRARLFLISTKAGGLGINLYAANRVVIFDASWNPSYDVQSIFRVYRFGQKKTCYIYRFIAEATMEEKIYERQVTKLSLAQRVVDEHQIERHYSMINLQELYSFEPTPEEKREIPKLPKDDVLKDMLATYRKLIVRYHEHDSLLANQEEEELTEEERKAAWKEYEDEKIHKTLNLDLNALQEQMLMAAKAQAQASMHQLPQNLTNTALRLINPGAVTSTQAGLSQSFVNPMFQPTMPLNIIQRGMQLGLTPLFNESTESFFNRVTNRERWLQMGQGPRET